MVQTRHRVRSLPGSISSQHDLGGNGRSKSLVSLNWLNSSPSTVGSVSSLSLNDVGEIPEFSLGNPAQKDGNDRDRSSSSSSADNQPQPSDALPDQPPNQVVLPEEDAEAKSVDWASATEATESSSEISVEKPDVERSKDEEDEVFRECSEEIPNNGESTTLSVIDEEKDDPESSAHLETLDEESDDLSKLSLEAVAVSFKEDEEIEDEDDTSAGDFPIAMRQRPSVPTLLMHTRGQSMSSLDIPHSYSQPETLSSAGDAADNNTSTFSTAQLSSATQISKLPVRRGLSSSFLSRDSDAVNRPISQNFDALGEGTVLVALSSSSSSVASKGLDRSLSASTPSIDSATNELARGNGRENDSRASRKAAKHQRTPSMVVPAITPRIPLMGLLPAKVSKPSERTGEGTKTKERSSGFFGTRSRRSKPSESRPHFWIKNSCSNSACCDVCSKPLANTEAFQCNDCLSSVHASCKASLDKSSCVKMKHPKPGKVQSGPLRPTVLDTAAFPNGPKLRDPDQPSPFSETMRSQSMKTGQRHSVVGMFPEASQQSYSMTAPAGLSLQPGFRTFPNGFRSYIDMEEEWKSLGLWEEFPDAWSTGPGRSEKKKLPQKEVKRQDNFHEMFITEQHHCQTLTVLKYTYFIGLVTNSIMPMERLSQLLPCLDDLIDIHYQFFRALKQKRDGALVVSSVHDVLMEQFSNETAMKMIKAYTHFCFQKDATVREYHRLVSSSTEFSSFIKSVPVGPFYKSRSLPDCLLLVTQRLSKYHSFVENLRKNTADDSPDKDGMLVAERAVKDLIASVDSGIDRAQMQKARMEICNSMDPKSAAELSVQDVSQGKTSEWKEFFKVDDLRSPDRTLLYYGDVFWQNARQKPAEITLLLFSDVIVFLQKNGNGGYNFFRQDQKNGIIRLHKLIVRDKAGRLGSQGIYLIAVSPKPDMYDISCKSKKELGVWMDRIQRAVQACSSKNPGDDRHTHSLLTGREDEELRQFFERLGETNTYMRAIYESRMKVYADMFEYIAKLPLRSNEEKEKIASLISGYKRGNGEEENAAAIWQAVQERFGSVVPEETEALNSEDVPSGDTDEKEPAGPGTELGRSKTFHFVGNSGRRPRLRKHPTIAGIPEMEDRLGKRVAMPQLLDDLCQKDGRTASDVTLYLLNYWADFAMEIEELRQEKLRLTTELALAKDRSRQTAGALACDSGLENLRRLSTELEARRKQFNQEISDKDIELKCREKALKEREEKVAKEEAEIQSRWACLSTAWENQRLHGLPVAPLLSSPSSTSNFASDSVSPGFHRSNSPADAMVTDSSPVLPVAVQRATSFRPMDVAVPPHLAGAVTNASRAEIRQQLPTNLSKDHVFDSFSKKWRASSKDKTGKKYFVSSKSPDRQMIPNKLAINKK